jgi:MOSC domain-containing protein
VTATVARLSIAPVKSLGLVHPDEIELEDYGVRGNRRFWLVDSSGRLYNGKREGTMVQVAPEWDESSRRLVLTFPGGARVEGTVELGEAVDAVMYRHPHPSRRVIGQWEAAISEFVGEPLTLLWAEGHAVDRGYRGGTISLVSRGSLERLGREGGAPGTLDGRRFRMLFEIDGVAAHEEDEWLGTQVRIGEASIQLNGDVGRCVVTSHDPDRGVTDFDTLGTLARYRRDGRNEPLPFGVYGSVAVPGRVRVGDPVQPLQERLIAQAL